MQEDTATSPSVSSVKDYIDLLKPRVMSLVVFCGAIGLWMAPGTLHPVLQIVTILCIAVATGASGAINMWYERDIDALMNRTSNRPVPAGRVTASNALAFGSVLAGASVLMLGLATNWMAAFLLACAIFVYVAIYTLWLKRRSAQNIVIGGASGAFPPMIGWAAVTGNVSWDSFILFLIIFLWTPAHFWALALYRHADYARANIPMLPVVAGEVSTKRHILLYTVLTVAVSLLPIATGLAHALYATVALLLGLGFLYYAFAVLRGGPKQAMGMFAYSMLYLFLLFAALPVDLLLMSK